MPPPSPLAPAPADARAGAGTAARDPLVLDCRGRLLDCRPGGTAHVVGVLNVTPDSFSDGGQFTTVEAALARAKEMVAEGAAVIDVGGESTRPAGSAYGAGAEAVSAEEETRRVVPVVEAIARELPRVLISIDTYKGEVARAALRAGAHIVNDVAGLSDSVGTARAAADYDAPLVVMHSVGRPGHFPQEGAYRDVVAEVTAELKRAARRALDVGVSQLVLDPGFGFGKGTESNLALLNGLGSLVALGYPVLVGLSRKRTSGAIASGDDSRPAPVRDRLYASLGLAAAAVGRGAMLVRTHDVKATAELLRALGAVEAGRLAPGA